MPRDTARRIISRPDVLSGEPVFEGTRIPVSHISGLLARGVPVAEILEDHPALTQADLAVASRQEQSEGDEVRRFIELRRSRTVEVMKQ